ncbi:MAG TPA: MarR family transcriptional regulator [Burkholderiaceae bacterium]|jgi:DNA-binding MarR family transcriptional regulator|nr:MarR family transcriptional regulator [Burkholderiaceae bacterium]
MPRDNPDDPLDLVHQLMHQVRSRQRESLREAGTLTPMDARVLGFFARRPGATLKDLAEHSGRDKAQLARLIKGLRDQGWLLAEADPQDRRNQCLTLTTQGQAVHQRLRERMAGISERAVRGLSAAERRQLCALLLRLQAGLADEG